LNRESAKREAHWCFDLVLKASHEFVRVGQERDLFARPTVPLITPAVEAAMLGYKLTSTALRANAHEVAREVDPLLATAMVPLFHKMTGEALTDLERATRLPDAPILDTSLTPELVEAATEIAFERIKAAIRDVAAAVTSLQAGVVAPFAVFYADLRQVCGGISPPQEEERLFGPILRGLYAPIEHAVIARYS